MTSGAWSTRWAERTQAVPSSWRTSAFSASTRHTARRAGTTLSGSYVALRTSTPHGREPIPAPAVRRRGLPDVPPGLGTLRRHARHHASHATASAASGGRVGSPYCVARRKRRHAGAVSNRDWRTAVGQQARPPGESGGEAGPPEVGAGQRRGAPSHQGLVAVGSSPLGPPAPAQSPSAPSAGPSTISPMMLRWICDVPA